MSLSISAVQQQLARAAVFRDDVGRGRDERHDRRTEQEDLAALDDRIGVAEVDAPGAQALHLPALEGDAGLVVLVDVVLVARALVLRDRRVALLVV